ncbi:MAG: universal stress protein [Vicinamibacterales bacterium]
MAEFKVMVPLDGSDEAEHALAYLDTLRCLGESRVLLFAVADELEEFRYLTPAEGSAREEHLLRVYLDDQAKKLIDELGIIVETRVERGAPAQKILETAETFAPDMMVLTTHGRSGFTRWRLGSVADKVIRSVGCNTLVVGPHAATREVWMNEHLMAGFRSILVPLDGSALAESALEVLKPFREVFSPRVHLIQVIQVPMAADPYGDGVYMPDLITTIEEGARDYLKRIREQLGDTSEVDTTVVTGPAATCISEYMERHPVDLVIMTSHGRGGIIRTALGSVTDRLIGGQAPVLVVRPQE